MEKRTEFSNALKEAMKTKDQVALSTMRLILAALKDRDIAARGTGNADGISESDILSMLAGMIKQRQESAKMYADAGRQDLLAQEEAEIKIIQGFLPAQLSEAEVLAVLDGIIAEIGAKDIKDMGRVMALVKTRYAGQMDMAKASALIKGKLG